MSVRVRYAPSPTGLQHIGGLRTALFNYLLAKALGGKFFLRIEDTDRSRYDPESETDLYDTLRWAGLEWDEGPDKGGPFGPYVQSERLELYRTHAKQLIADGKAYECYCTAQRLDQMRKAQEASKSGSGYDRHCLTLSAEEKAAAIADGVKPVVRFHVPTTGITKVEDRILGLVEKANADIAADPVILKSDGFPTYHLAHVVDDHLMETTHVLRAQEWLPSAPLHVLLFQAFGWKVPQYCHLPLILGQDGQKLSKRHGDTSVRQFKEAGYLPEAMVNYLALLGWSYDDSREFFTLKELEQVFSLDRLNKSPGVFDYKKLEHFNGHYLRAQDDQVLKKEFAAILSRAGLLLDPISADEDRILTGFIPLLKERLKFTTEVTEMMRFVWEEVSHWEVEDLIPKKLDAAKAAEILKSALVLLDDYAGRSDEDNEAKFREKSEELGVKLGDFMHPIRVGVTGSRVSPPMFGTIRLLGTGTVKKRLQGALRVLEEAQTA